MSGSPVELDSLVLSVETGEVLVSMVSVVSEVDGVMEEGLVVSGGVDSEGEVSGFCMVVVGVDSEVETVVGGVVEEVEEEVKESVVPPVVEGTKHSSSETHVPIV